MSQVTGGLITHRCCSLIIIILIGMQVPAWTQEYTVRLTRGITYVTRQGVPLQLDIYQPLGTQGAVPTVLAIHGGSWTRGSRIDVTPMAMMLGAHGYAVVAPNYRLAPASIYPAQLDDVRAAVRWMAEHAAQYGFDPQRLVSYGESAGAQLAALLALQPAAGVPRVSAVIDMAGPMNLTVADDNPQAAMIVQSYLGAPRNANLQLYRAASPVTYITSTSPPFLIIHGTADDVVPYSQSVIMTNALRNALVPVTLLTLQGLGHQMPNFSTPDGLRVSSAVLTFLGNTVGKAAPAR